MPAHLAVVPTHANDNVPTHANDSVPMHAIDGVPRTRHAPVPVRMRAIGKALARFEPRLAPRLSELARRHPAVADLAISFPALLFAYGMPRRGFDPAPLIERTIAGDRLDRLARKAGVAGWLRALPPEAFRTALPLLPDSPALRLRLANHRPRSPHVAALWLESVITAFDVADEEVAVWIAAELAGSGPPPQPKYRRPRARTVPNLHRLCLWAWASSHGSPVHDRLHPTGRWSPDLHLAAAGDRAYNWLTELRPSIELGLDPDPAATPLIIVVHGFEFVPLTTAGDLSAEADAMQHCVRDYADSVAEDRCRLWSVRVAGDRVATLETSVSGREPWPRIVQLMARANANPPLAVWQAARAFVEAQDQASFWNVTRKPRPDEDKQRMWTALWRPYWLAKRRVPSWLPAAYRSNWWI